VSSRFNLFFKGSRDIRGLEDNLKKRIGKTLNGYVDKRLIHKILGRAIVQSDANILSHNYDWIEKTKGKFDDYRILPKSDRKCPV
jgi:hypothetical protein